VALWVGSKEEDGQQPAPVERGGASGLGRGARMRWCRGRGQFGSGGAMVMNCFGAMDSPAAEAEGRNRRW
jgi:hypothetical protein